MVTNRSNNMLLFGSWSNRNNNSFPSVVGINSIINHSQYPKTALAKHSVGFTRYNIPLDVMITGAKWERHSFDIRCCQPIRCPLITNGVQTGWCHMMCAPSYCCFPRRRDESSTYCNMQDMVMPSSPPPPSVLLHPEVVSPTVKEIPELRRCWNGISSRILNPPTPSTSRVCCN